MPVPFWRVKKAREELADRSKACAEHNALIEEMHADALAGFRWYLAAHDEMDAFDARP